MTVIIDFDYENRLTEVKQGTTTLATFLYDADGNRVKGTDSGTTTVYIAGIYERQGAAYTSYYEGGGLRRSGYTSNNGVFYMLTDHLKSTSYGGWVCQDTEVPIHKVEHPPVLEDPHLDSCGSRGCGEVVNCGFLQLSTCPQPRLTSVRRHSQSQDCRQPDR